MMTPLDDAAWLTAIREAAANGEWASTTRLVREFYADPERTARQSRAGLLEHVLLLCRMLDRLMNVDSGLP